LQQLLDGGPELERYARDCVSDRHLVQVADVYRRPEGVRVWIEAYLCVWISDVCCKRSLAVKSARAGTRV